MFRRARLLAACLALLSLGALPLHAWAHLRGHGPEERGGEPCQVCRQAPHLQPLAALAAVQAPQPPCRLFWAILAAPSQPREQASFQRHSRGPPKHPQAS